MLKLSFSHESGKIWGHVPQPKLKPVKLGGTGPLRPPMDRLCISLSPKSGGYIWKIERERDPGR